MTGEWVDVAAAAAVRDEEPCAVEVDGHAVLIARCESGYFAVEDRCTHDGEPLSGGEIERAQCRIVCPRHGARFCLKTGAALTPPAYEPVRTYNVRAANGRILLQLPE